MLAGNIPVIIPAYEPDERLLTLLDDIKNAGIGPVIVVNDGSDKKYNELFSKVKFKIKQIDGSVLEYAQNKGKGRALKTAFLHVLEHYPNAIGVVTADSDGQHTVECIKKVMDALQNKSDSLILGVRDFDSDGIPWKSEFGNKLTMKVLQYVAGIRVSDTQTGLRGIPKDFLKSLINVKGERFEFETQMLLESSGKYPIQEIPVKTIYDSIENHQTHFNPLVDSIKIYKILGKHFLIYTFASLSSSILDLFLFAIFCSVFRKSNNISYVAISTVLSRIISAAYNFTINYNKVFRSKENIAKSAIKYAVLAIIQMACSASLSMLFIYIVKCPEVIIKGMVDTFLFFISYKIQQNFVFR